MDHFPLCEQFGIDSREIHARHAFLGFSTDDEDNLARIHTVLCIEVDPIITEFYAHLMTFGEVREFLADEALLRRLQATQREYLLGLGRGRECLDYWEARLRIGMAHERVRLPQKWYLGAYVKLFELIRRCLVARHVGDAGMLGGLLETLQKIFTLDAILAVETYHQANVHTLKRALDDLTEAQQALQQASRTDGLTGVRNRTFLMECLSREFERSRRHGRPFSLLFIDLDHFKRVNDRHGHACGDEVLRKTVEILSSELRSTDVFGRFGGEEFLLGLVETELEGAKAIAERIRHAVERTTLEVDDRPLLLTVSIGVASLANDVENIEGLIDRADRALYRAKQGGRNRVYCFELGEADSVGTMSHHVEKNTSSMERSGGQTRVPLPESKEKRKEI